MNFFIKLIIIAVVTTLLSYFLPGIHVVDFKAAIIFAFFLAVFNATVKPVLSLLTFPINFLTLGLVSLLINILIVSFSANLAEGIKVDGFVWTLALSLILSLINSILD